jgi:hypothetical protein
VTNDSAPSSTQAGHLPDRPHLERDNWFDEASNMTINNVSKCPLVGDVKVSQGKWPFEAQRVIQQAGPRRYT